MKPIYLIGDVHGCYKTMIALIEKLPKDAEICFLGDLIDRGQNSASVIQYVIDNNHSIFSTIKQAKSIILQYIS